MKKLGNQTGTSEASLTNRIQVTEKKILQTEDTIEEIVISVKKKKINLKHDIKHSKNMGSHNQNQVENASHRGQR